METLDLFKILEMCQSDIMHITVHDDLHRKLT